MCIAEKTLSISRSSRVLKAAFTARNLHYHPHHSMLFTKVWKLYITPRYLFVNAYSCTEGEGAKFELSSARANTAAFVCARKKSNTSLQWPSQGIFTNLLLLLLTLLQLRIVTIYCSNSAILTNRPSQWQGGLALLAVTRADLLL